MEEARGRRGQAAPGALRGAAPAARRPGPDRARRPARPPVAGVQAGCETQDPGATEGCVGVWGQTWRPLFGSPLLVVEEGEREGGRERGGGEGQREREREREGRIQREGVGRRADVRVELGDVPIRAEPSAMAPVCGGLRIAAQKLAPVPMGGKGATSALHEKGRVRREMGSRSPIGDSPLGDGLPKGHRLVTKSSLVMLIALFSSTFCLT